MLNEFRKLLFVEPSFHHVLGGGYEIDTGPRIMKTIVDDDNQCIIRILRYFDRESTTDSEANKRSGCKGFNLCMGGKQGNRKGWNVDSNKLMNVKVEWKDSNIKFKVFKNALCFSKVVFGISFEA